LYGAQQPDKIEAEDGTEHSGKTTVCAPENWDNISFYNWFVRLTFAPK
jgi:hypothetical protein